MVYYDFKGLKLSALGMGCMRFPVKNEDNSQIDEEKTAEMFDYAIKNGVNYFDTAWGYHSGMSELVTGKLLSKYPRESFYLTSKFPGYDAANLEKKEEVFEKQLEKCRVNYFDFYLFHNVTEKNIDNYLDEKYGIYEYLIEQKRLGRIRHLGFSTHGNLDTMKRFLDAYGKDMEFCQLQINWLDWGYQNAKAKCELVASYGIPVWVMEPVRGGSLVKLDEKHLNALNALNSTRSAAEWAFRFIQSLDNIGVTLSGMSNFEQLKENIELFSKPETLKEDELRTLFRIAREMTSANTVPCTACGYCKDYCPMELDIPDLLELYNEFAYSGGAFNAEYKALPENKKTTACIGCRSCEAVCPQEIKISEAMADFAKRVEK